MNKIKLSPKQKEVIQLMRRGCALVKSEITNSVYVLSEYTIGVKTQTFNALHSFGIICKSADAVSPSTVYELTELGKTIEL